MQPFRRSFLKRIPVPGIPRIDWSHPLAKGMVGCWLPGLSNYDLTGNCPPLTLSQASGAQAPRNIGIEGPVFTGAVSAVGGNVLTCLAPSAFKNWNNFSVYYRGPRGTGNGAGAGSPMFYVAFGNGVSSPFDVVSIGDLNGDDLTGVCAGWNDGSTEHKSTSLSLVSKTLISLLGTFTVGGNNLVYVDGVQASSNAWSNSTPSATSGTDTININGWLATGRYTPTSCNITCAWNRTLSAAEAAQIDRDPYCFLVSSTIQIPRSYVGVTVGVSFIPYNPWPQAAPIMAQ